MSFQSKPTKDGTYRIKVLNQDLYIQAVPKSESTASTPWMCLAAASPSNEKQKWQLKRVPNTNDQWTICSCADGAGIIYKKTSQTYRGHGFPYPGGESIKWLIQEHSPHYSKISTPVNGTDCFDSQYGNSGDNAVHFWTPLPQSRAPLQCFTFEYIPGETLKMDVLFVQDATGSQQPYIGTARSTVVQIATKLRASGDFASDDDLRFGVISFRDHPPQDRTYVTKDYGGFSSDINSLKSNFENINSAGGGDGPEAQCDALDDALNVNWRDESAKLVILITDSPPHGVEKSGDFWPDGCPDQNDPCRVAGIMKERGIVLNVLGCEPVLSQYYENAANFYAGLVSKTGGDIRPLVEPTANETVQRLSNASFEQSYEDLITGFVLKLLDTAKYAAKYKQTVEHQAFTQKRTVEAIVTDLHREFQQAGARHYNFLPDGMYASDLQGETEANIWAAAKTMKEARQNLANLSVAPFSEKRSAGDPRQQTFSAVEPTPVTRSNVDNIVGTILRQAGRK